MKQVRIGLVLALMLGLLTQGPALGVVEGNVQVIELNFVYAPDPANTRVGRSIRWTNQTATYHTTTSNAPLSLWDSGRMQLNDKFTFNFYAAGSYPYHCEFHEGYGMFGTVAVQDKVSPAGGPVGTVFTIRIASIEAPTDYVYDVQKMDPGGQFEDWVIGATTSAVQFDSTGQPTGVYQFQSRLRRLSDGAETDYSPPASITVTQ